MEWHATVGACDNLYAVEHATRHTPHATRRSAPVYVTAQTRAERPSDPVRIAAAITSAMLRNILLITTVPGRGAWLQRCLDGAREGPFAVGVVSSCAAASALLSNADGALSAAGFLESCPGDGPAVAALQRQLGAS